MKLTVGYDCGNSEMKVIINGELIKQPSVFSRVDKIVWEDYENTVAEYDNMTVTINSPLVRPAIYKVGELAIKSGDIVTGIQFEYEKKQESDVPYVMLLATIAEYAVKKAIEEKNQKDKVNVTVDMTTAIPIPQYTSEEAEKYSQKYIAGKHNVTVHLGGKRIDVEIKFDFVKTLPEGVPVAFTLNDFQNDDMKEFNSKYGLNVDGNYFKDKKVLHVDIGDGTCEYPVTEGQRLIKEYIFGSNNGVGYALEASIDDFNKSIHVPDSSRQYFSLVLKNKAHKHYAKANDAISTKLEAQSRKIMEHILRQLTKTRNTVDVIVVYGGGSILMKKYLSEELYRLADERDIKVLFVPENKAALLNAFGLYSFVKGDIFKALKKEVAK